MSNAIKNARKPLATILLLGAILLSVVSTTVWSIAITPISGDYSQIAQGRYMLAHGINFVDTISWTSATIKPSVPPHEWLYQVTSAFLYAHGGFNAMELLLLLCRLGIFVFIALLAYRRSKGKAWVATAVVLLTGAILSINQTGADYYLALPSRPQTLSILLLLAVAVLLEYGGKFRWGIIPLLILGANWHGAFWPLYLIVIVYYAVRDRSWWLLLAPLVLLLNPAGAGIIVLPFSYAGNAAQLSAEWARTNFWPLANDGIAPFLILLLIFLGIWLGKLKIFDLGIIAALLMLALSGQRFVIFAIVLGIPLLAVCWDRIEHDYLSGEGNRSLALRLGAGLALLATPMLILMLITAINVPRAFNETKRVDLPTRTEGAYISILNPMMDYIGSHGIEHVLPTTMWGGDYMAFAGFHPFIYNRSDVFLYKQSDGSRIFDEYIAMKNNPAALRTMALKYGAEYVLDVPVNNLGFSPKLFPELYQPVFTTADDVVLYRVLK